jgi:hypothetical protein
MNHFLKKKDKLNPKEFTNTILLELTFFEGANSMLNDTPMVEVLPSGVRERNEVRSSSYSPRESTTKEINSHYMTTIQVA